jgi:DNA-binding transcriptional regulator YhcF (GntR family)
MFHEAELILDSHRPRAKKMSEDTGLNPRLQLRYADGELERLGIVSTEPQTKLFVQYVDKSISQELCKSILASFGELEEFVMVRD